MKISITGHTSGIGLNLYKQYQSHGHEILGFSRSTGHDIGDIAARKIILDASEDCDVFVNNAYSPTGQTELLLEFIKLWNGQPKKIINISSKLSFFELGKIPSLDDYIKQKSRQNEIIQSRFSTAYPQILNVIVGLVDTPMSNIFQSSKLNPTSLTKLIYDLSINDQFYVQQIIVDVPGLDWKNIKGP